jgi:hypothetical protein
LGIGTPPRSEVSVTESARAVQAAVHAETSALSLSSPYPANASLISTMLLAKAKAPVVKRARAVRA